MCLSNEIIQGADCQVIVIGNKLGSFIEVINAFKNGVTHYMAFSLPHHLHAALLLSALIDHTSSDTRSYWNKLHFLPF